MGQRDFVKIAGGIVIGIVLAAALGAGVLGVNLFGDTKTSVTLWEPAGGGPCTLGKVPYVHAKKDKKVIWEIKNYCEGGERTVTVGNFRTSSGPSGANNCDQPGADYPFTDSILRARTATVASKDERDIKLKVKGRGDLGENELRYFFDICLDGKVADPELMVER